MSHTNTTYIQNLTVHIHIHLPAPEQPSLPEVPEAPEAPEVVIVEAIQPTPLTAEEESARSIAKALRRMLVSDILSKNGIHNVSF